MEAPEPLVPLVRVEQLGRQVQQERWDQLEHQDPLALREPMV